MNYLNYSMGISQQSRLDCATEVNYPHCLLTQTAGESACDVVPLQSVEMAYNACISNKFKEMEANICPLPGETHDGYGNCIPATSSPVVYTQPGGPSPVCYTDGITEKCYSSPVPLRNAVPQERTPLQEVGDWFTARQGDIASIITPKPNPPCRDGGLNQCHLDWQAELKKSKDIVKWVAIGLAAYILILK